MSVFIVEVLAIYELPGVTPSGARVTQRDSDLTLAGQRSDAYAPGGTPPTDEYLEATQARYGFGWRARQFISVQASAQTLGTAVFNRLNTRSLQAGSKVIVFPDFRDGGSQGTGAPLYQRSWPRATPPLPDIG